MGTVELLVGVVLGIDALIVVGIVASRLTGRRSRRPESAPPVSEAYRSLLEAPPSIAQPPEAEPPEAAVPEAPGEPTQLGEEEGTPEQVVPNPEPALASAPGFAPMGLDFAPTWVDPMTMAAAAASEWRRGLRRDLARAARRGRPGLVMHLKLDVEGRADLSIQELARLEGILHETIAARVRDADYVDRTGPGRFHMILSEMPESGAVAVADRIIHAFREDAPDSPRLLVGWAAMETEGDVALALQRAAERVRDGSLPLGDGDLRLG